MKNPTRIVSSSTPHAHPQRGIGCWRRLLAASLTFCVVAVLQTVRADTVIYDNDFNNATNNLANNDLGIGGGFSSYSRTAFGADAYEKTNYAFIATSFADFNMASIDSINPIKLAAGGTTIEFKNVNFSTNTPFLNIATGGNDELLLGVTRTNGAGNWFANTSQGLPGGFWIQLNSDSIPNGTGSGGWTGTSSLFYKGAGTNLVKLISWKFDHLKWGTNVVNEFSEMLDIKLTLSSTGWALNITGDTATNNPISYSGTYAAGGAIGNSGTFIGITNELLDGINSTYIGAYIQTANPPINMGIDRVTVTQLGSIVVTTPSISTPQYGFYNTNTVYAGEAVTLSSSVTAPGSPTLQWQMEDMSAPGTFVNVPSGNAASVNVSTTGFDNTVKGFQLIATYGGTSVTSAVVRLTVIPASVPVLVQDITPTVQTLYAGEGGSMSASFTGNKPITYQWQSSPDGSVWTDISGETNDTYVILSMTPSLAAYYKVIAHNSQGSADVTTPAFVFFGDGVPPYLWSAVKHFGGLSADQILTNFPSNYKIAGAMYATNAGLPVVVGTAQGNIVFGPSGLSLATVSGQNGFGIGASTNVTGNANFDTVLNYYAFDSTAGTHSITLSNLIVGQQYQVQLFALDDRRDFKARQNNWVDSNPLDAQDVSMTYKMGDDVYILANFVASNTVQVIQQNLLTTPLYSTNNGNFNCLVLRTVGWNPPPYWVYQPQSQGSFDGLDTSILGIAAGDSTIPNPAITYQWKAGPHGGPYTNLVEGSKYIGTTTTNLTVHQAGFSDGGTNIYYVLAATNGAGGLYSAEAQIYVQGAPVGLANGSYGALALANNPAGLWMLDETNNANTGVLRAYDSSGNGKHGIYGSAVQNGFNAILSPQPPSYAGFYTNEAAAKMITGNRSGFVVLPSLNFTNLETSYVLWINPADNGGFAKGLLYHRNTGGTGVGNGTDQIGGFGYANGGTFLGYNWNDNAATYTFTGGPAPVQNRWQLVALVIESDKATIYDYYMNDAGQAVLLKGINNRANTAVVRYSGGLTYLGNDSFDTTGGRVFNGPIAGAAIFNHSLSEAKIQQLFAVGVGISTNFPPSFVTQPLDTPGFPNSTVQLRTVTSGTTPVTNQWTFNGTNLVDGVYGASTITGSHSNILTIQNLSPINVGVYNLILSNSVAALVSSNASISIITPTLVGEWLPGSQTFADVSGYSPAGKHDAYLYTGSTYWTNDVPPSAPPGSFALHFAGAGLEVSNSASTDAGYKNTFDSTINGGMTVMVWAKGWPANWGPFLSKYGDNGFGWQLRVNNSTNFSCWTTRNSSGGGDLSSTYFSNDGKWHHYAGTFNAVTGVRYLYVDGVQVARSTGNGAINPATSATGNPSHVEIGARDNAGNRQVFYTGTLFDARIYDYELPQYQIVGASKGLGVNVAQNVYVTAGSTRTFPTPGVDALPPYLGYRWQFNNGGGYVNLSNGDLGGTISGASTTSLTITGINSGNAGLYQLLVTNGVGVTTNGIVNLTVMPSTLLGKWLTGSQSMADSAGFAPAGTHNAGLQSGTFAWSSDVPTNAAPGSFSLSLTNAGLIVSNSAAYEAGYVNTFDDKTLNGMTVACWARGWPGAWNPFVSKYGEGPGWQVRNDGNNNVSPCWSLRWGGGTVTLGLAVFGNAEDLAATSLTYGNDGIWHHYAGTYDLTTGSRKFYVDGLLVAQVTGQGQYGVSAFSHLMIGGKESGGNALDQHTAGYGNYFTGKLYDVRVYNYSLSQDEIRTNLLSLPPLVPILNPIVLNGNKVILSWSSGTLNSSTNVAGPYLPVSGATSPYTNLIQSTVPNLFYKVSIP